jgi:hypothetical protein
MGNTARKDNHKPSVAEYGNYVYLATFYLGAMNEMFADFFATLCEEDPMSWEAAKAAHSSFEGNFDSKGTCDHCGANFLWGACYLHTPTGELVHVGHTCAGKSFDYPSRAAALKGKASRQLAKIRKWDRKRDERSAEFWAANADLNKEEFAEALETDHYISRDLKASFEKWGRLSEKQVALAFKIGKDIAARKVEEAAKGPKEPVPSTDERITVTGKLISLKWQRNHYGETLKMLVEDDRGFRLWGTFPTSLEDAERGDRVTFCAAVERSDKDEFFGFTKRPTKGKVLASAAATAAAAA